MNSWLVLGIVVVVCILGSLIIAFFNPVRVSKYDLDSDVDSPQDNSPQKILILWSVGLTIVTFVGLPWLYSATTTECVTNHQQLVAIPFINQFGPMLSGTDALLNLPSGAFQDSYIQLNDVQQTLVKICSKPVVYGLDLFYQFPVISIWLRIQLLLMIVGPSLGVVSIFVPSRPVAIGVIFCASLTMLLWFGHLTSVDTLGITDTPGIHLLSVIANLRPGMGYWLSLVPSGLLLVESISSLINSDVDFIYQKE